MTDKTAGVIGGMGPDATVDFMATVIAATPASKDQDHVHLLVDQNPKVPNRQAAQAGAGEDPGPAMAAMAKGLESAGADFLVIGRPITRAKDPVAALDAIYAEVSGSCAGG